MVYEVLEFFFIKIKGFALSYPIQPFRIVFGENISDAVDFQLSAAHSRIKRKTDYEILAIFLQRDNYILGFRLISISKYGQRMLQCLH